MKKEISFSDWYYAVMGLSENPVAADEIMSLAERGELVVVTGDGKRATPKKIEAHQVSWGLEPEKQ